MMRHLVIRDSAFGEIVWKLSDAMAKKIEEDFSGSLVPEKTVVLRLQQSIIDMATILAFTLHVGPNEFLARISAIDQELMLMKGQHLGGLG